MDTIPAMSQSVLPESNLVPSPLRLNECRDYLIDGQISSASQGNEVFSPIRLRSAAGYVFHRIGYSPLVTADDAQRAVAAAQRMERGQDSRSE